MKKQAIALSLLTLAIAATVGCGNSTAVPTFTRVALLSNRVVVPVTSLYTANLDGSNVTPIPFSTTNVWSLSNSADGKTLAFTANISSTRQLWVSKSDGTGQKQLTTPSQPYWVRISPSGKKVTYDGYDGTTYHVFVINTDGTGNLDLTPTLPTNMSECYEPSFSADSSQIVFVCYSSTNNANGIYTVNADGTGTKTVEVRAAASWADYPYFTPDGKKVLFVGPSPGAKFSAVISVNRDGSAETVVVSPADEFVVLNSNLFYESSCTSPLQIFKAKLDGTNPVQVSDSSNNQDLYYPSSCN